MVESVLIDSATYRIEWTDEPIHVDGRVCRGDVDYNRARIRLSSREDILGEGQKVPVLMHEVVHAMLYERGRCKDAEDEDLVDALAAGFVNLVRQNPGLVQYIQARDDPEAAHDIDRIAQGLARMMSEAANNYDFAEKGE